MKIRSTLIVLSLILGLMSCSYNSGVLKEAQPATPQNTNLKTIAAASHQHQFHMLLRGVNNTEFVAGGGILTHVDLVQKGNSKLGIKEKRVTIFDGTVSGNENFNDLLDMNSGIMLDLSDGQINPPPGLYDYAVATVAPGSGWVEAKDGTTYPVKFPGNKFILVFKPAIEITTVLSPDVVLDIDVSHSLVPVRGGKSYIFKPIVKVQNNTVTGSVVGIVNDENGATVNDAYVYVDYNGTPIAVSPDYNDPGTLGYLSNFFGFPISYWIPGIPAGGTYTIYAEKDGYNTASAEITINAGNFTFVPDLTLTQK